MPASAAGFSGSPVTSTFDKKMKTRQLTVWAIIIFGVVLALMTPLTSNLLGLSLASGHFIPEGSSIFTFRVTQDYSEYSGDWWKYGEDWNYYYFYGVEAGPDPGMKRISKATASAIRGFSPTDFKTWK